MCDLLAIYAIDKVPDASRLEVTNCALKML